MNTTASRNFDRQQSEDVEFSIGSVLVGVGIGALALICYTVIMARLDRRCKNICTRHRSETLPTNNQNSGASREPDEIEAANERTSVEIEAAIAENEAIITENVALLNCNNAQGSERPVTNHHAAADIPLAPPPFSSTTAYFSAPPPSYDQVMMSDRQRRELHHDQLTVCQLGLTDSPPSHNRLQARSQCHRELRNSGRAIPSESDPNGSVTSYTLPHPLFHQLPSGNRYNRDAERAVVRQLEESGYTAYANMLADLFNRARSRNFDGNSERQTIV